MGWGQLEDIHRVLEIVIRGRIVFVHEDVLVE